MDDIILKIVKAEYVEDYVLRLTFNNGELRLMDFAPLMEKGVCRKLHDLDYFKSFTLDPFTVDWEMTLTKVSKMSTYGEPSLGGI